jgi:hypothetical protein
MAETLSRMLQHPIRRRVLLEYMAGPAAPADLARRLDEPLNRIAYHTTVLARHECIELVGTERRRGARTRLYRAAISPEIDGSDWEQLPVAVRRALTLGVLDQAMDEARRAALNGGFDDHDAHVTRFPLTLDDEGVEAVAALLRGAFQELAAIVAAAHDGNGRTSYEIVMLAFERPPGDT